MHVLARESKPPADIVGASTKLWGSYHIAISPFYCMMYFFKRIPDFRMYISHFGIDKCFEENTYFGAFRHFRVRAYCTHRIPTLCVQCTYIQECQRHNYGTLGLRAQTFQPDEMEYDEVTHHLTLGKPVALCTLFLYL